MLTVAWRSPKPFVWVQILAPVPFTAYRRAGQPSLNYIENGTSRLTWTKLFRKYVDVLDSGIKVAARERSETLEQREKSPS